MNNPSEDEIADLRDLFHNINNDLGISSTVIDSNKFEVLVIPGGSSNTNYKIQIQDYPKKEFFVKHQSIAPVSRYYQDNLVREYDVTKFLSQYQLAPKPLFLDKSRKYLVSEFSRGVNPNVKDKNFSDVLTGIGNALTVFRKAPISLLKRLTTGTRLCPKRFFTEVISPTTYKLTKQILEEGSSSLFQFLEEINGYLHDRLQYQPQADCRIDWDEYKNNAIGLPWGLIHNDFSFRNFLYSRSIGIKFVDWEFADFGDIAYDLAYLQSENLLLEPQIKTILDVGNFNSYIYERTLRYIRIFLPILELANAYWTLNHITRVMKSASKKIPLRPPNTIGHSLEYVRWKLRRLTRLIKPSPTDQTQLYQEIQQALKMFEVQLIMTGK